MKTNMFLKGALTFSWLALAAACGGGDGSGTTDEAAATGVTAVTESIEEVPVVGELAATCTETGFALIEGFLPATELPVAPELPLPVVDLLALGDPSGIPVLGGFVPSGDLLSGDLVPISPEDALAMLPAGSLPDLPALGSIPVSCDALEGLPTLDGSLPATDIVGLIPVFGENGDVIGTILATASNFQAPGVPDVTGAGIPDVEGLLPEPLGSLLGSLLSGLPLPI